MREFKFRTWSNIAKRMNYTGFYINSHGGLKCSITDKKIEADSSILMQYTGLKDKNGREIYDGDILSYGDYTGHLSGTGIKCLHKVEWDNNRASFATHEILTGDKSSGIDAFNAEVIGNIYENPELIKK